MLFQHQCPDSIWIHVARKLDDFILNLTCSILMQVSGHYAVTITGSTKETKRDIVPVMQRYSPWLWHTFVLRTRLQVTKLFFCVWLGFIYLQLLVNVSLPKYVFSFFFVHPSLVLNGTEKMVWKCDLYIVRCTIFCPSIKKKKSHFKLAWSRFIARVQLSPR